MQSRQGAVTRRSVKGPVETVTELSIDATSGEAKVKSFTIQWDDLEDWQRDNEYIVSGYRRPQNSWRGCFTSVIAYLHNETVNIHSHLWGAALFVYILATFYPTLVELHELMSWKDAVAIVIFLFSAILCLAASAFYHTATCHSEAAFDLFLQVASHCHAFDYSGIIILIVGSFIPSIYYGFFCHSNTQKLYLTAMTLAGIGAAFIVLDPEYAKPTHRGARTTVFIALGLCAIVPVTHLILTHGFQELISEMGVNWLLTSGALYIGGALLYANRIPERFAPGRFDLFLASHQIFHFCVVLAALAHYKGVLVCLRYRLSQPLCG
ncbi:hemolysin-III related-domain-containing protein [Gymnopilus junonius]|uniref:Hemolysin-III related-domain-containing protein n=1 Tax=Gymnopilus junonius TaxID=109634 RepID=A0A9P5NI77_GYMJU|nr:hemolysin-III related-domain-containing protein [Gymnopilus junonius]